MKKCPKCNGECLEESKFCGICGYEFTDKAQLENNSEENISMENDDNKGLDKNDINDGIYEVVEEDTQADVIDDKESNKGNKNNKIIGGVVVGIIVAVLAIATTLIFGKNLFNKKAPQDRLVDAYEKLVSANTIDMNNRVSITNLDLKGIDNANSQISLISNIIKDFSIDFNTKLDRKELIFEGSYGVSMKNNKIFTADFYVDKELAGINIPFVYNKAFYIPWGSMMNKVKQESGESFNLEDYLQLFDEHTYSLTKNLDEGKYKDIVNEFLKEIMGDVTKESVKIGDKKIDCDRYTLQFDLAETMKFGFKIMDEMVKDEDAQKAIYEVIDKISEKVIENKDYTFFDRTEEEFKEEIQKFKNEYEKMLNELDGKSIMEKLTKEAGFDIDEIEEIIEEAGINIKANVFIDKDNNIRKNDFIIDIHDALTDSKMGLKYETVINSINKKLEFNGIDKSNSVNPLELNEEQLQKLVEDIQETFMNKFLTNPLLGQLMGQFTGGQIF